MNPSRDHKYFLQILIGALSVSALIGIYIFLAGDFGETEVRLLFTTLAIGGYSLAGLCCSVIYKRKELMVFSIIGMLTAVAGFTITTGAIWEILDIDDIWKTMVIFIILSAAMSHVSLLLQIRISDNISRYLLMGTIASITIVALMLIKSTLTDFDESEFYFRMLGVFAILDVLGTIAAPVMNRIGAVKNPEAELTARTPKPPYYAVIFSSIRTDNVKGYAEMAERMTSLAREQEGFLGVESARNELGITVSYWKDLESIKKWKAHEEHIIAQEKGKSDWYRFYKTRIAVVEREYEFQNDKEVL